MGYFIQRGETVNGPFNQAQLKALAQSKKLRQDDRISDSANGPWEPLSSGYKRIFRATQKHKSTPPSLPGSGNEQEVGVTQSKTALTIPAVEKWKVKRGLRGKYTIAHECPKCATDLNSDESDIQQRNNCPRCGAYFTLGSAVAEEIASDSQKRVSEREQKAAEKQKQRDAKQKQREREAEERATAAKAKRSASEAGKQQSSAKEDNNQRSKRGRFILGAVAVVLLAGAVVVALNDGDGGNPIANILAGAKVKKVTIKAGEVTITDKEDGLSHVTIECNNGLVIDADWERNRYNDFGYDIYEPEVNMDYNRLALMIMARGVIANYLKGEYD